MEYREYQLEIAQKATSILSRLGIVYLALEMRVGKTLIALLTCHYMRARRVLFVTKKKAISSIEADFKSFDFGFAIHICNYEQVEKAGADFDVVVIDEAHSLGAFPKPALRTKNIRQIVGAKHLILLSGTPSPESYSQLYHQFWISDRSPFAEWSNFYKWSREFVKIKQLMINGLRINNYDNADRQKVWALLKEYFLTYTQEQAGFKQEIEEFVKIVDMKPETMQLVDEIVKERIITTASGANVIADTAVSLQQKVHQICSGTIINEDGVREVLDCSKAEYIATEFVGQKKAIFYKYIAESQILKSRFNWTESPEEFNVAQDKVFISQVRSGSMGVNLSTADVIIFYNIDFSAVLYWQARARAQSKDRTKESKVAWIFARGGIEEKIYEAVTNKKDYTLSYFERDFIGKTRKRHSRKDHKILEDAGRVRRESAPGVEVRSAGFVSVL